MNMNMPEHMAKLIAEILVDHAIDHQLVTSKDAALFMLDVLRDAGVDNAAELCRDQVRDI